MAKTQWADGSYLTPAQMILFFGDDAVTGHSHDGLDADGSCPQITIEDDADDYIEDTFGVTCPIPYADAPTAADWKYVKIGKHVTIFLPSGHLVHSTANDEMQVIATSGNWPADIVPTTPQQLGGIFLNKECAAGEWKIGSVTVPAVDTSNWVFFYPDASAILLTTGFGFNNTTAKGLAPQSFSYYVD